MTPRNRPDYERVAEDIRQQIRSGTLAPGARLPTGLDMIRQYGVSRQVIDAAVLVLVTQGWVRGHQGRGRYVADDPPELPGAVPDPDAAPDPEKAQPPR